MNDDETSIDALILSGVVEVAAIDSETGEFLYCFTNKFKELMPEMYEMHVNNFHSEIMSFWEIGVINIDDIESSNPIISLTEKAFDESILQKLSTEQIIALNEIKRILKMI